MLRDTSFPFKNHVYFCPSAEVEGCYEIGSLHPSVHLSRRFLKFWHGCRNSYKVVCDRAGLFENIDPKIEKMGQKWVFWIDSKICSLLFSWIWSIMKVHIICCIPVQIPYLEKFWFLRYGPACSWSIRLHAFQKKKQKKTK